MRLRVVVLVAVAVCVAACGALSSPVATGIDAGSDGSGDVASDLPLDGSFASNVDGAADVTDLDVAADATVAMPEGGDALFAAARVPVSHRPVAACPSRPQGTYDSFYYGFYCNQADAGNQTDAGAEGGAEGGALNECATDSDCLNGVNGRCDCLFAPGDAGLPYRRCVYDSCESDRDCTVQQACYCQSLPFAMGPYVCFAASCHTDSDCGDGGYCSPSLVPPCGYTLVFACHTPNDECVNDEDCTFGANLSCVYNQVAGRWDCESAACADW